MRANSEDFSSVSIALTLQASVLAVMVGLMGCEFAEAIIQPSPQPLPTYRLALRGDDTLLGSGVLPAEREVTVSSSSTLELVLRPEREVAVPMAVSAYLRQGGQRRPWGVEFRRSSAGTLRLRQRVDQLPLLKPGHWSLQLHLTSRAKTFRRCWRAKLFGDATPDCEQIFYARLQVLSDPSPSDQ